MMLRVLLVVALVSCALGHMCMISPPQRGAMENINTANTMDCGWTDGPCGGIPAQDPNVFLVRGTNFTVTWQKNENHWFENYPGSFNLSWADAGSPDDFDPIYSFEDTNSPSLTLYSYILDVSADIPVTSKVGILQLAYVCPGLPAVFYQCADVMVV